LYSLAGKIHPGLSFVFLSSIDMHTRQHFRYYSRSFNDIGRGHDIDQCFVHLLMFDDGRGGLLIAKYRRSQSFRQFADIQNMIPMTVSQKHIVAMFDLIRCQRAVRRMVHMGVQQNVNILRQHKLKA
jgi:hypothetical protein